MKKILYFVFLFTWVNSSGQSYTLIINDGTGSGSFSVEDTIPIWARTTDDNQLFDHWEGNGLEFLLLDEWQTDIVVSNEFIGDSIHLQAVFKSVDNPYQSGIHNFDLYGEYNEDASTRFLLEKECYYWMPENPKAIVFVFHGSGGSASMISEKYEVKKIIERLVDNNYGVLAFSSNETDLGDQNDNGYIRWNAKFITSDTSNNIDLLNTFMVENEIKNMDGMAEIPFFSLGVSNGAVFSDLVAGILDYKASAHIVGKGSVNYYKNFDEPKPTIWIMSENDHNESADNIVAFDHYSSILEKEIPSEWFMLYKTPVIPYIFTRSSTGIDINLSIFIYNWLKNNSLLDENDYLIHDDLEADFPWLEMKSTLSLNLAQYLDVRDQLKIINADHTVPGKFNKQIIRFFNDRLGPNEVPGVKQKDNHHNWFSFYPNPSKDVIHWKTPMNVDNMIIVNERGNKVKTFQPTSDNSIDISNLPAGVYFAIGINSFTTYKGTFVKQ